MTDKEYQIFISALSARYWRSGETLYNVQTAPKLQKCLKLTTFHISQHLTVAQSIVVWIFAFLTEGIHYITKAWSKIWSCLSIRKTPRKNFHLIIFYRPPKRSHKDSQELIWSLILIIGHESRFFVVARRILKRSCGKGDIWKPSSLRSRWGERYPGVGWLVWKLEADNQYIGRGSHHNMQPDCDTKYDLKLRPTMLKYTFHVWMKTFCSKSP